MGKILLIIPYSISWRVFLSKELLQIQVRDLLPIWGLKIDEIDVEFGTWLITQASVLCYKMFQPPVGLLHMA